MLPGMHWRGWRRMVVALLALLVCCATRAHGAGTVEVLTNNYDNARSGANLRETTLTTKNVTPQTFGRAFSYHVDGPVFAQPLLAANVRTPHGALRTLVYVATASNSVYAFDADSGAAPLWQRQLASLPDGARAAPGGILGTPVIDRSANILYVVAALNDGAQPRFVLHALDLSDGADKLSGPVVIGGAVKIDDERIDFEPNATRIAVQRAALALAADKVIVAFGGDFFEGWVFAYQKSDLRKAPAAFCTTCASRAKLVSNIDYLDRHCIALGPGGGIWQAGRGPPVDADGVVYFFTGNKQHVIKDGCAIPPADNACAVCAGPEPCVCKGNRSANVCRGPDACVAHAAKDTRIFDTNEALIALDARAGLALRGWFRPQNWNAAGVNGLEVNDLDLGGSGPLLLPNAKRLIGGGKQGVMYLLDTAIDGGHDPACVPALTQTCIAPRARQSFQLAPIPPRPHEYFRAILGGPVLWTRSAAQGGSRVFVWRQNDQLRSYALADEVRGCGTQDAAPDTSHHCPGEAQSEEFLDFTRLGANLTLSADGADAQSAIVWAASNIANTGPGKLAAFRAQPLPSSPGTLEKLWDSDACAEDRITLGADFTPPTVANGRVYVASGANRVDVFGLLQDKQCTLEPIVPNVGPMLQ